MHWHCLGIALALALHCIGFAWHCIFIALHLSLPWHCIVIAFAMHWYCLGIALALFWHCIGITLHWLGLALHCHCIALSLPYHCIVIALLWQCIGIALEFWPLFIYLQKINWSCYDDNRIMKNWIKHTQYRVLGESSLTARAKPEEHGFVRRIQHPLRILNQYKLSMNPTMLS